MESVLRAKRGSSVYVEIFQVFSFCVVLWITSEEADL